MVLGGIGWYWAHLGATRTFLHEQAHAHRIQGFIINQTNRRLTCPPRICCKKGIASGDTSCYIILEGEQDVLGALPAGASHAHIAGPPCGPSTAAGRQRRFEISRTKIFSAAILTESKRNPAYQV